MARAKGQFGRRGPPIVTERTKDRPAEPPPSGRKRTLGYSLIAAGALAAAAAYHLEGSRGDDCVPDTTAAPAIPGSAVAVPGVALEPHAVKSDGGIGDTARPCPPGSKRESRSSGSSRRSFAWHGWSSSSSYSTTVSHSSTTTPSAAVGRASSSSTTRGGFGSIGSFHSSGHSSGGS